MSKSESTDTPASKDDNVVALKRGVGLLGGVAMIVGSCVGSGIFISPQGTLRETGSVGMSLIIWVFCAIIAMCGEYTSLVTCSCTFRKFHFFSENIHNII